MKMSRREFIKGASAVTGASLVLNPVAGLTLVEHGSPTAEYLPSKFVWGINAEAIKSSSVIQSGIVSVRSSVPPATDLNAEVIQLRRNHAIYSDHIYQSTYYFDDDYLSSNFGRPKAHGLSQDFMAICKGMIRSGRVPDISYQEPDFSSFLDKDPYPSPWSRHLDGRIAIVSTETYDYFKKNEKTYTTHYTGDRYIGNIRVIIDDDIESPEGTNSWLFKRGFASLSFGGYQEYLKHVIKYPMSLYPKFDDRNGEFREVLEHEYGWNLSFPSLWKYSNMRGSPSTEELEIGSRWSIRERYAQNDLFNFVTARLVIPTSV